MPHRKPKAAVILFPGSNGDRDLLETFDRTGFDACVVRSDEDLPDGLSVVGLPGGFAYGDYWRAGMLASQARAVQGIRAVVEAGGLALGICNGFQILVESGLLPGALSYNDPPGFRHRWLTLRVKAARESPWLYGLEPGTELRWPMSHGEGSYFHPDGSRALAGTVPLVYTQNPNGSLEDAAGLLDETGRILGVMPHPERAADPLLGSSDGARIFEAARTWLARERA